MHLRKTKDTTPEQWICEINSDNVELSDKLEDMVASLDKELACVMDTLAPVRKCTMSLRPKKLWYDSELQSLKKRLRKHERNGLSTNYNQTGQLSPNLGISTPTS